MTLTGRPCAICGSSACACAGERLPSYLHCFNCGKQVSTGFYPVPTDTPDRGLIVRAAIACAECVETAFGAVEDQGDGIHQ